MPLLEFKDNELAATAGIPLWGLYRTGGIVKIRINNIPPNITLLGPNYITVIINNQYIDPGIVITNFLKENIIGYIISITDGINEYITTSIPIIGTSIPISNDILNTNIIKQYTITYSASDSYNNTATVTRIVTVGYPQAFNVNYGSFQPVTNNFTVMNNTDWTCEIWVYMTSYNAAYQSIFDFEDYPNRSSQSGARQGTFSLCILPNTNTLGFFGYANGNSNFTFNFSDTAIPLNKWCHCVWMRQNDNLYGIINGVSSLAKSTSSTPYNCFNNLINVQNLLITMDTYQLSAYSNNWNDISVIQTRKFKGYIRHPVVRLGSYYNPTINFFPALDLTPVINSSLLYFLNMDMVEVVSGLTLNKVQTVNYYTMNTNPIGPTITLNGNDNQNLIIYTPYVEQGVICKDVNGTLITDIIITGTVNINILGKYIITYNGIDKLGTTVKITRTVNICINGIGSGLAFQVYSGYHQDDPKFFLTASLYKPNYTGIAINMTNLSTSTNQLVSVNQGDNFSILWIGYFYAPIAGNYTFYNASDDGSFVWLSESPLSISTISTNNALIRNGSGHNLQLVSNSSNLKAGIYYNLIILYGNGGGGSDNQFSFTPPNGQRTYDGTGYLFCTQPIPFGNIKPTILFNGSNPYYIKLNSTYLDPGITATDLFGNTISTFTVEGTVNTSIVGKNILTYTVVDNYGVSNSLTRSVNIVNINISTLNPFFWIDPSNTATVNISNGNITSIMDQTTNQIKMIPLVGNTTLLLNGINNLPVLNINRSGLISEFSYPNSYDITLAVVVIMYQPTSYGLVFGHYPNNNPDGGLELRMCGGNNFLELGNGGPQIQSITGVPVMYIVTRTNSIVNMTIINLTNGVSTSISPANPIGYSLYNNNFFNIGNLTTSPSYYSISKIGETIYWKRILSSNEINYITFYLTSKWGVNPSTLVVSQPTITLIGQSNINLLLNDVYTEPGLTAIDFFGNTITSYITTGTVNTTKIGNYTLTYTVTDIYGNSASISRKIYVKTSFLNIPISDIFFWIDASDSIMLEITNGFITSMTDKSINAIKMIAYYGNTPLLENGINNLPIININNSGFISAKTFQNTTDCTIAIVIIIYQNQDWGLIFGHYQINAWDNGMELRMRVGTNIIELNDQGPQIDTINGIPVLYLITRTNSGVNISRINLLNGNTSTVVSSKSWNTGNFNLFIGKLDTSPNLYIGKYNIGELMYWTKGLTNSELSLIQSYLIGKWSKLNSPTITLNTVNPSFVLINNSYTDPGAIAKSYTGSTLTYTTTGSVNTSIPNTYQIIYNTTDVNNSTASITRNVYVVNILPMYDSTVLLLLPNNANGWSSTTDFLGNSITNNGNISWSSTGLMLDGNSWLTISLPNSFNLGSGPLTFEGLFTLAQTPNGWVSLMEQFNSPFNVIGSWACRLNWFYGTAIGFSLYDGSDYNDTYKIEASIITLNILHHYAVVINDGSIYVYFDGNLLASKTITNINTINTSGIGIASQSITIGKNAQNTLNINGSISMVRIVKKALYTGSTYTVPTLSQLKSDYNISPNIILNGENIINIAINSSYIELGASVSDIFGNTLTYSTSGNVNTSLIGQYIITYTSSNFYKTSNITRIVNVYDSLPENSYNVTNGLLGPINSNFNSMNNNNWTVECWVYLNIINTNSTIIDLRYPPNSNLVETTGSGLVFTLYNGIPGIWNQINGNKIIGNTSLILLKWSHIVWTCNNNIIYLYINGKSVGNISSNLIYTSLTIMNGITIGNNINYNYKNWPFYGQICQPLITIGVKYSISGFIPNWDLTPSSYNNILFWIINGIDIISDLTITLTNIVTVNTITIIPILPIITLINNNILYLPINSLYVEYGAICTDYFGNQLTYTISNTVNTSTNGTYQITYSTTDSNNSTTNLNRTVIIYNSLPITSIYNFTYGVMGKFLGKDYTTILNNTDFTVEMWIYATRYNDYYPGLIEFRDPSSYSSNSTTGFTYGPVTQTDNNNGKIVFSAYSNTLQIWVNGSWNQITNSIYSLNQWNHLVWMRYNNNLYGFINGYTDRVTNVNSNFNNLFNLNSIIFGCAVDQLYPTLKSFYGYMSQILISSGAKYSNYIASSFTPETDLSIYSNSLNTQFFLGNNYTEITTNTIIPVQYTINQTNRYLSYIQSFDCTNGYIGAISPPSNTNWTTIFNSDFTFETWLYPISYPNQYCSLILDTKTIGGSNLLNQINLVIFQNGTIGFLWFNNNTLNSTIISTDPILLNQWSHIVWMKKANNFYVYLNGKSYSPYNLLTNNITFANLNNICLCHSVDRSSGDTNFSFQGQISHSLFTNLAKYNASFIPNIDLTPSYNDPIIIFFVGNNLITTSTIVNPILPTVQTLTRYGSVYNRMRSGLGYWSTTYNASNTILYLYNDYSILNNITAWTCEGWFYTKNIDGNWRNILSTTDLNNYSQSGNMEIGYINNKLSMQNSSGSLVYSTDGIVGNSWNHFAVVQIKNTIYFYINGISRGTTPAVSLNNIRIVQINGAPNNPTFLTRTINGYYSQITLMKYVKYTTDFLPNPNLQPTSFTNYLLFQGSNGNDLVSGNNFTVYNNVAYQTQKMLIPN
jgi:hypothetical protein